MERIKDIWQNRRVRGILFIIFYLFLFSYIFIVYGSRSEKIIMPENKPAEIKKIYSSYEYEYKSNGEVISVQKYNDIVEFKILDLDYYYLNGKCYLLEMDKFVEAENPLKYNFDYLNNLDQIKKISTLVKTSNYADGTFEENYNVNLASLLNIFDLNEEGSNEIITNYSIYKFKDEIKRIVFNDLNFEINYTNLNGVSKINIDYEFYE